MTVENLKTATTEEIVSHISGLELKDRLAFLLEILDTPSMSVHAPNIKPALRTFKDELLSLSVFNMKLLTLNDGKDWNSENIINMTIDFLKENEGKDIPKIAMEARRTGSPYKVAQH